MKKNLYLKILVGIVVLILLIKLVITIFIEPWVGGKIEAKFNEKNEEYIAEIDKVHISIFTSGIELENISIGSKLEHGGLRDLNGEIASVKLKGINIFKFLFKNDINISEVTISNSSIKGKIPFPEEAKPPNISKLNIRIDSLRFDKIDIEIGNPKTAQLYSVKEGVLKVHDLTIAKFDTLSPAIIKRLEFRAEELFTVSADSMYTLKASNLNYSDSLKALVINSFSIHPNYKDYDFTALHKYQSDRIEAGFSNIFVHDFSAAEYFRSKSLLSSYIEIGNMDLKAFRDIRKDIRPVNKPTFQEMIYNYPGTIRIDSICLLKGNVEYTEHAKNANEAGFISFNEIKASLYKITNDTIYKTEKAYLELNAEALLMGKGKMTVLLKSRLYDNQNTFSVNGNLSGLEAKDLNPMLEKNAFVYATSGKIDGMNFSFTANNNRASGKLILLYHGLDIAVKNKRTDETTAIKEQVISLIANIKVLNSNPVPGDAVRTGIIDYERNPNKFLFNYCAKSILSGIKTSLTKESKK